MSGWDNAAPSAGNWDSGPANSGSGWDNVGAGGFAADWGNDTKAADTGFGESNGSGGPGDVVSTDDAPADQTGGDGGFACYNCGAEGHASKDCTEEKKPRGECYNCGEVGHNKADCPNPRVERPFTGTCRLCEAEGHRASECPTRPPDICKNCQKEGHKAAECENSRVIDRSKVPDMTVDEAMALLKEASDERDLDDFKKGVQAMVKASNELTYIDIEQKLRAANLNLYFIATEKEVPKAMSIVDLQGVTNRKYIVNYMFSAKPKRAIHAVGWPETAEDNLEKLKDAGEAMPHVLPLCRNCDELGHTAKRCPEPKSEKQPEVRVCHNCAEQHMTRLCPGERPDRSGSAANVECRRCHETGHFSKDCPNADATDNACRNCGQEGHKARDCTEERSTANMTCRNCNKVGHMAKECTEPRDMSTMVCRNCDETGHGSRECPKPRDYSRVECTNCHKMGHTKVRCKEPEADANAGAGDFNGDGESGDMGTGGDFGGGDNTAAPAPAGDWNTGTSTGWDAAETETKSNQEASGWGASSPSVSAW